MSESPKRRSRVPKFRSLEEEAEFWDTHDTTEFEDEFKEVKLKFARPLVHLIEVELDGKVLDRLFEMARAKSIGFDVLVRQWIEAGLEQEEARMPSAKRNSRAKASFPKSN